MKKLIVLFLGFSLFLSCHKNKNSSGSSRIDNKDQLEKSYYHPTDFSTPGKFTSGIEGPAWGRDDHFLYVVNFRNDGTVGRIDLQGKASLFVELPEGSTGNGIRFHADGSMLIADYTGHNILKVDMKTKEVTVYVHNDEMNQPNDLAISGNNTLYLSDPDWKNSTGKLWKVDPDKNITLLEDNMGTTNGIEVAPGDSILYVNESTQKKIWAYDIMQDGNITNKRLFYSFNDFGMDGMRCDKVGNLYVTRYGKGTVVILSPKGEKLQEVMMKGKNTSNIAFGGLSGQACFVTLQDRGIVERFFAKIPGRDF